jgi:hypothetical protein
MLKNLYITFEAKIAYANISVLQAGWKIWNWVSKNFTIIDSRIFNRTTDVSDTLLISSINKLGQEIQTKEPHDVFISKNSIAFVCPECSHGNVYNPYKLDGFRLYGTLLTLHCIKCNNTMVVRNV